MKQALLLILLSLGLLRTSTATRCYVCTSDADDKCHDPYVKSADYEVECSNYEYSLFEEGGCYKSKIITKLIGSEVTSVTRGCGQTELITNDYCVDQTFESGKTEIWICGCVGDKCNTSATLRFSIPILSAIVLVQIVWTLNIS